MHSHTLITPGLASFGELSYLDIEFTFSGNVERKAAYRLVFCPPSLDPVAAETMHAMLGDELKVLCVSVVSFADIVQLENPVPGEDVINIFAKPTGSFDLDLSELNYLYGTLVDFMIKVADAMFIQILFFAAEREELYATYSRYVKRLTKVRGLTFIKNGAAYAIRTQHYPKQG